MKRPLLDPCLCRDATVPPYGYSLFKWTRIAGGRWKQVTTTPTVFRAVMLADKLKIKCALITCRNCGADILREYPEERIVSRFDRGFR